MNQHNMRELSNTKTTEKENRRRSDHSASSLPHFSHGDVLSPLLGEVWGARESNTTTEDGGLW